jgi:Ca2+/H+ antiporter
MLATANSVSRSHKCARGCSIASLEKSVIFLALTLFISTRTHAKHYDAMTPNSWPERAPGLHAAV